MTREDIICMGAESKISLYSLGKEKEKFINYLESFASLVASSEREACAKVCEYKAERYAERAAKPEHERDINLDTARIAQQTCFHLADNIRARGQA
jgi:hypothetical protein